jgi:O-antigen ligase
MHPNSATANLSTERQRVPAAFDAGLAELVHGLAALLSGLGLFLIVFTLIPFEGAVTTDPNAVNEGNIINQVGYLVLGAVYLFAMLLTVDRRILARLVSPSWIAIFAIAYLSCLQSYDPAASARGLTLSLIAMIMVAGVLVLPRSERDFVNAGANAILLLILIDYAALFVAPDRAIHSAFGDEPWHAGFWRGHLLHKNVSAPVFSILCMFGIYCLRAGAPLRGWAITLLAANFVLHTGSKTTIGFLPIAIGLVFAGRAVRSPSLMILAHLAMSALIFGLTLGSIYSDTLLSITKALIDDPTFTGRDDIWKFASASIAERPWLGQGYASFWLSPVIMGMEANFEASWDVRGIVTGHNSYLDAVLMFGVPGGILMTALLFVKPLFDYIRAYRRPQARILADFCVMVVIFMTYNAMLESFVLHRADPMWLLTARAVFGLGLAGRMSMRAEAPASRR